MLRLSLASLVTLTLVAGCGSDAKTTPTSAPAATVATTEAAQTTVPGSPATTEDGTATAPSETSGSAPATTGASGGDAAAALDSLVAAAKKEGSVTLYSIQALDPLNELAAAFKEKYGIEVTVVRGVDADTVPRVETELATNTSGGDLVVSANELWVQAQAKAGSWVDPTASPRLAGLGDYDAKQFMHEGNYFEVGAAVLTFAWNTSEVPGGLKDYPDLLDPALGGGRIAVIDPSISPTIVDYYFWLQDNFGDDFLEKLAAQKPRIYPSALPIGEALTSGEVAAAAYAAPIQLEALAASGAPVDYGLSAAGAWGARYYGFIPKSSDSPNAAALLADFMVSPEGQAIVQAASGSVQQDVEGTIITNDKLRRIDWTAIAPDPAAAFGQKWDALFR